MSAYTPPLGFHFQAVFELGSAGAADTRFQEVSGLSIEREEEVLAEGGENRFQHRLPARGRASDLTLKRGLLISSGLRRWIEAALYDFVIQPVTVTVSLLDETHQPIRSWIAVGAWPKKWAFSDLNAEASGVVIETLDLSYRYLKVQ